MIRTISLFISVAALLAWPPALRAESAGEAPDFKEVYDLIREHLAGTSPAALNRTAVQALVSALGPKVSLVESSNTASRELEVPLISKNTLFDGAIPYLRIGRVDDGLAKAVHDACDGFGATNKLTGLVLDMRYAGGNAYAAAAAVADLFLKKERPLLNWGNGMVRSKEKTNALTLPVAVLVNGQTSGAAEALAAALRETGAGLIFGSPTAGQAMIAQEFPLSNGGRLRIATTPVQLGDGSALSPQGVKPDISVDVNPADERAYYLDSFKPHQRSNLLVGASLSLTNQVAGTNRTARRGRINEADLVRERRDGLVPELESANGRDREPEEPVVHDPALARALDVLKGLAVVRHSRS